MRALELPDETKARLAELESLSQKAEAGDKEARNELRRLVRSSSPEVIDGPRTWAVERDGCLLAPQPAGTRS
jgi:hypothetical protein